MNPHSVQADLISMEPEPIHYSPFNGKPIYAKKSPELILVYHKLQQCYKKIKVQIVIIRVTEVVWPKPTVCKKCFALVYVKNYTFNT